MKWNPYKGYDYPSGGHVAQYSQQVSHRSHSTSLRQTGVGNSSKERERGEDMQEENHDQMGSTAVKIGQDAREMQSQYQKDFPPPSSCRRRRTPALPQSDNIGINPAFRWERVCQRLINVRSAHEWMNVCVRFGSQVWVQHSPKRGLPWLVHHEPRVYWQAGSGLTRTTKHYFWVIVCNIRNQLACELPGNKCFTQQSHLLTSGSLVTHQPAHLWLWNIINNDKHYNNVHNYLYHNILYSMCTLSTRLFCLKCNNIL